LLNRVGPSFNKSGLQEPKCIAAATSDEDFFKKKF
jgi:hypothetical protein